MFFVWFLDTFNGGSRIEYINPQNIKIPKSPSESANGMILNISFAFKNETPFKSYIRRVEPVRILSYLNDKNLITKLDPLLGLPKVEILYFRGNEDGKNMTFVYIEGIRCKSDGITRRCWAEPSFCLGWEQFCFEADDKYSLCNNPEIDSYIGYFEKSSLLESMDLLWAEPSISFIVDNDDIEAEVISNEPTMRDWHCNYVDDIIADGIVSNITQVLCTSARVKYWIYSNIVDKGYNVKTLKTFTGIS